MVVTGLPLAELAKRGERNSIAPPTRLTVWDVATEKQLGELELPVASSSILCQALTPDGELLATAVRQDGNSAIYFTEVPAGTSRLAITGIAGEVQALAFSPRGNLLGTGSASESGRQLQVWNVKSGEPARSFADLPASVWCLVFSPDGKRLATGLGDSTILVWDVSAKPPKPTPAPTEQAPEKISEKGAERGPAKGAEKPVEPEPPQAAETHKTGLRTRVRKWGPAEAVVSQAWNSNKRRMTVGKQQ